MSDKDNLKDTINDAQNNDENGDSLFNDGNPPVPAEKRPSLLSSVIDYAEVFVVALSVVIIIFSFFIRICEVKGPSMENTLSPDGSFERACCKESYRYRGRDCRYRF